MSRGVSKIAPQALFIQGFTRGKVHFAHADSWPHRLDGGLLSTLYSLVHVTSFLGNRPYPNRASLVRAITCEYNTEVANHESPRPDGLFRGPAMGQSRPRARGDDRWEGHLLSPGSPCPVFHFRRDLRFLDSRMQHLKRPLEQPRPQLHRFPNAPQFILILYHTQAFHNCRSALQPQSFGQQRRKLFALADGYMLRLNPNRPSSDSLRAHRQPISHHVY